MKMQRLILFLFVASGFFVPLTYSQTPSATARDVIDEVIEQAAKETSKSEKPIPPLSTSAAAETREDEYWCQKLLKASIQKYLPQGYSTLQTSLIEMTRAERSGGMHCKVSVTLQGPASFNAIRYRIYKNEMVADRGFDSLSEQLPQDVVVIADNLGYQHNRESRYKVPCRAFTTGKRTLTFVSCADQLAEIVVSGVSSQSYADNSVDSDTITRAGVLLETGIAALRGLAGDGMDDLWKEIFTKDKRK